MPGSSRIPTPFNVRWQRLQYQIMPVIAVITCSFVAWLLWIRSPHLTSVGQVSPEAADVRSPSAGTLLDPPTGALSLYDAVSAGQVIARVERERGKETDITAPTGGQLVRINIHPGQPVKTGELLFTIAADHGRYVTTYLRPDQRTVPELGSSVSIRLADGPSPTYRGSVARVGPQLVPIPSNGQRKGHKNAQMGLPVIIALPPEAAMRPGEAVYVAWDGAVMPDAMTQQDLDR